ncbi:MAG: hypothetical protein KKB20_25105 [Proteobacteria bacterium]|nr:hypothetical protein [Pseudomonadota bacterium]
MSPAFQNPLPQGAPARACIRESCQGCALRDRLLCRAGPADLLDFGVLFVGWAIPFFYGLVHGGHWIGLVIWIVLAASFFLYGEAFLLCRHCPHYAEEGRSLTCHANYGLPKLPRLDPRPMNRFEQALWLGWVAVLFLYFIPFFIAGRQWLLLVLNSWALLTWAWTLQRTQCVRCYHLSCPVNRVPRDDRALFYENYPDYAPDRKKTEK